MDRQLPPVGVPMPIPVPPPNISALNNNSAILFPTATQIQTTTMNKDHNHNQSVLHHNPTSSEAPLIDYRLQQNHFLAARFIFECGVKLEARPTTTSTAAALYHQFFKVMDEKKYDIYLIGATSLYLAGKHESQNLKLRDVINVAHSTIHRNSLPLDLNDKYWSFRDAIIQAELLMMRALKFQTDTTPPHKFLVHYLKTLEEWIGYDGWSKAPVARTSWSLLQDFHHDSGIISYPPQALAVAAIQLAMSAYGAQVPLCSSEGKNSWPVIVYPDVQQDIQEEIMLKMLSVYDKEVEVYPALLFRETVNGK